MSPLRPRPRSRRGASAIELALLMGVFVAIMGGILDYGWYFFQRSLAISAARDGCRAGAVLPKDNVPDPATRANTFMADKLSNFNFSCGADGDDCTLSSDFSSASPTEQLQCSVTLEYQSFTGVIPLPPQIQVTSTSLLENQD